jgi:hypothetical protein
MKGLLIFPKLDSNALMEMNLSLVAEISVHTPRLYLGVSIVLVFALEWFPYCTDDSFEEFLYLTITSNNHTSGVQLSISPILRK